MRTRPWPLVLLAVCQILTPLISILFNAIALKVSPAFVLSWILQRSWIEIFETLFLMPLAGLAIYQMKSWSYLVFFAAIGWSVASNVRNMQYASGVLSLPALLVIYGLQAALVVYFLLPAVRTTFFDPTVRWWESKPRYELKIPAQLTSAGAGSASPVQLTILNLSEGGAFASLQPGQNLSSPLSMNQVIRLTFNILTLEFAVSGKIVHRRDAGAEGTCYGIQFDHDPQSLKRFQALSDGLKRLGFQDRTQARPWYEGLRDWALTLAKTGRGLTPEPKFRSGPKA